MTEITPNTSHGIDPALTGSFSGADLEAQKIRLGNLWAAIDEVRSVPELMSLFDRTTEVLEDAHPEQLLSEHGYPTRSNVGNMDLGNWTQNLDPRFVKEGFMYLFRGDNPAQGTKGFYARTYGYGKKSTEQLATEINSPSEVGYALYKDDRYLTNPQARTSTVASELAYLQSAKGGSSFISTTTNLEVARGGTGNQPTAEQKEATEIYIVKVPVESVINSNTSNFFGLGEDEYLVSDYILPTEVVGRFGRNEQEKIYALMHQLLGTEKEASIK